MDASWFVSSATALLMVLLSAVCIYATLILFTRLAGLRSFSKMSSFDFAVTVAIGSVVASTVLSKTPSVLQGAAALAALYLLQIGVASLRGSLPLAGKLVNNKPLLLMKGTKILTANLKEAKVTRDDLRAKLREANVTRLDQVKAVVMEATGDISVLHHENPEHEVDAELLHGVDGFEESDFY